MKGQPRAGLSVWTGSPASPVMLVGNVPVGSSWNCLEKTAAVLTVLMIFALQTNSLFSKFREQKDLLTSNTHVLLYYLDFEISFS